MPTEITTELAGEQVLLLPERALFWPRAQLLIAADLHWGKAATFRAAGMPVPEGSTAQDLLRLDRALARTGARGLALLGDLLHARAGRTDALLAQIATWRARRPDLAITLVRGNHDRHAGDPPAEWGFAVAGEPLLVEPFLLCHHPQESPAGYVLAGHLHPAVRLRGAGRQQLRLPCFWFGSRAGVLPAFGDFTGSATIAPAPGDRVFALAGEEVLALDSR